MLKNDKYPTWAGAVMIALTILIAVVGLALLSGEDTTVVLPGAANLLEKTAGLIQDIGKGLGNALGWIISLKKGEEQTLMPSKNRAET